MREVLRYLLLADALDADEGLLGGHRNGLDCVVASLLELAQISSTDARGLLGSEIGGEEATSPPRVLKLA